MILSNKREEWDNSFNEAYKLLLTHPEKLGLLEDIYADPTYYAGYVIKRISDNLNVNGSTMAEINHSSVIAHLGPSSLMEITQHLMKLLERQQHLYNKEREADMRACVARHKYESKYNGDVAAQDTEAKNKLSTYAHLQIFRKAVNYSEFLTCRYDQETKSHIIWPA